MKNTFWIKKILGFACLAVAFVFGLSWIVMQLWNQVAVAVLHVSPITYWQAAGLLILAKILFGGFGKSGCGSCCGKGFGKEMKEKWGNMSPEEKEAFKQQWRNKCRTWQCNDTPNMH